VWCWPAGRVRRHGRVDRAGAAAAANRWCRTCSIALRRRLTRSSSTPISIGAEYAAFGIASSADAMAVFAGPAGWPACAAHRGNRHPLVATMCPGRDSGRSFPADLVAAAATLVPVAEAPPRLGASPSISRHPVFCAGPPRCAAAPESSFLSAGGPPRSTLFTQPLPPLEVAFDDASRRVFATSTRSDELSARGGNV